ncbi:ganglioside-induced differentiation-associated protein 1-like [Mytilus californianus]|uniref:ganglioside-induced differentiation-associated protein 1-like n=1 Tax=Mytilus californianus TaxID=6549 RepID=UPI0022461D8C|nr:ganglioside-induced differentiation-associated protein 1-like [Mytilus californianus]
MSENRFTLYYFYTSNCAQKVLLALFEKGCPFNRKIINIHSGEQNDPEFMKLNPKGQVPVLKDGDNILLESEEIIDHIDQKVKAGARLVPDRSSAVGKEVQRLRDLFAEIDIGIATFGVLLNRDFSISGVKMPGFYDSNVLKAFIKRLETSAEKYPDLRNTFLTKVEKIENFAQTVLDKEKVAKCLDDVDNKFEQFEGCLVKNKAAVSEGQDYYLAGPEFTAADIDLIIYMDRMTILGLEDRFFAKARRPLLHEYLQRIEQRKSVKMLRAEIKKIVPYMFWRAVKSKIPFVTSVTVFGLAFGIGVWFMKNK